MSGYSFWCTPCGKDHAGECPPRKKSDMGYAIEVRNEFSTLDPPQPIPAVGSRWIEERHLNGTWTMTGSGNTWTVGQIDYPNFGEIQVTIGNGRISCTVPLSAFSAKGASGPTTHYRLVAAP